MAKGSKGSKASKGKGDKGRKATNPPHPDGSALDDGAEPPAGASEALQTAALHAIAAAKAFLDVAERAVQDPQMVGEALVAVRTLGKGMLGSLASHAGAADHHGDADDPPLEHIDVT